MCVCRWVICDDPCPAAVQAYVQRNEAARAAAEAAQELLDGTPSDQHELHHMRARELLRLMAEQLDWQMRVDVLKDLEAYIYHGQKVGPLLTPPAAQCIAPDTHAVQGPVEGCLGCAVCSRPG